MKVAGGTIEAFGKWIVAGTGEIRNNYIATSEFTGEIEAFYTEGAARHALWVVNETIRAREFREGSDK